MEQRLQNYTLEEHQRYVQGKQEKRKREEQARSEKPEKESARRSWIADGGREADFERTWLEVRDEERRRRVVEVGRNARQAMRGSGISQI